MDTTPTPSEATARQIPLLDSISEVGARYPAWIVDIWGVMHDGLRAHAAAVAATAGFRTKGGIVVLLSNSPRPSHAVQAQLAELGVPAESYDATITSGDLTRHELASRPGAKVFHLGPKRDLPIFSGLDLHLVGPEDAELIVCSGLFDDETETPADYNELLESLAERRVPMLCANPDHMVERGNKLIYCAGALADLYQDFDAEVIYAGKPYPPVYELAFQRIDEIAGRSVPREMILAIGDGINTDMAGAARMGLDAVFIAGGLHAADLRTIASKGRTEAEAQTGEDILDGASLAEFFGRRQHPLAAMRVLA